MLELKRKADRFYFPVFRHPVARILKFRNVQVYLEALPKGGKILDYGSGDRPYEVFLLTRFDEYVAGDHPEANAAHLKRPDLYIENNKIELPDESVDCVMLTEVLEHCYEPQAALQEIFRVLKPGGHVVGSVPYAVPEHEQPYDFFRYTSFALRNLARDAGLEVDRLDYVGDMVGVHALVAGRLGDVVTRALRKLKLTPLAWISNFFVRLPEVLYLCLIKTPLSPQRLPYFRDFPMGFTFQFCKPEQASD